MAENLAKLVIAKQVEPDAFLIVTEGHPSQALEFAHEIARTLLSPRGAWGFVSINFNAPDDPHYGDMWQCEVYAVVKATWERRPIKTNHMHISFKKDVETVAPPEGFEDFKFRPAPINWDVDRIELPSLYWPTSISHIGFDPKRMRHDANSRLQHPRMGGPQPISVHPSVLLFLLDHASGKAGDR